MTHTTASLIAFRDRIADAFREKRIRSPVHFPSDTQAEPLCQIFKDFKPGVDWLFSQWRNMFHALLAGMPEDELFEAILQGRSMYLMDRPRKIFCSSIVGGHLPIALGVAWSIKRQYDAWLEKLFEEFTPTWGAITPAPPPMVWVLVGDMTRTTGIFNEFERYVHGHGLPVKIIVEDNGLSTNTPTREVWGHPPTNYWIHSYTYERNFPHVGLAEKIQF